MSKPTIWWFGGTGMTRDPYGFRGNRMKQSQGYVEFNDYAALAAENERLRKAGDELEDDLFLRMNLNARLPSSIAAWNAAKEGRDAK